MYLLKKRELKIAAIISLASVFTTGWAATQGTTGTTSTGTVLVSIVIPSIVRITGLSDIAIGTPSDLTTSATGLTTACIYSNQRATPGGYAITATSLNSAGAGLFSAKNTATTSTLNYTATWASNNTNASPTTLTSGTKLTGQLNASSISTTCSGGSNATFAVSFAAASMQSAPDGTYTDTVTLVISPT